MLFTSILFQIYLASFISGLPTNRESGEKYPTAVISNNRVTMKLYLPDKDSGYYRGTRFDWSGIIYSLDYKGHQYFGEWSKTRNPLSGSDITGPVNGYLAPGLGYYEAAAGGEFIRIGVGVLEKPEESSYQTFSTYKIIDNGKWAIKKGKDWIEFRHEVKRESGWGYIYKKRIELSTNQDGFLIKYSLKNTGIKEIETDQFNHNFFIIDKGKPGPDFSIKFPFACVPDDNSKKRTQSLINNIGNELVFTREVSDKDVWLNLTGFKADPSDNHFEIINKKTGAGITVQESNPLSQLIFWANSITLCPETFIFLKIQPGEEKSWSSSYALFTVE